MQTVTFRLAALALAGLALYAQAAEKPAAAKIQARLPVVKPVAKPMGKSMTDILAASAPGEWRPLNPDNTLYMELPAGRVVIELAPGFAPAHAANIRTLAHEKFFDGTFVLRSQDNYVVQWGDPAEGEPGAKSLGSAQGKVAPELTVDISAATPFRRLPDFDGYAPQVGFSDGFAAAQNPKTKQTWLTHCYGSVGVSRGEELDSGNGSGLYVAIAAPRHLDRNYTVVGRVVQGMEMLSTLPRGTGPLGFYEKPEQRLPITSVRFASEVPAAERSNLEVLRTDSQSFADVAEARRNRRGDGYVAPAGYIALCNVPLPVRTIKP